METVMERKFMREDQKSISHDLRGGVHTIYCPEMEMNV